MKTTILALTVAALAGTATADVSVGIDPSGAAWLGYMNVFELPANGGGFVFGSSWGVADLVANFDDGANTLTMSPNTIGDPNEYWYQEAPGGDPNDPNNGGPGAPGNKIMQANLYQESFGGLAGQTVNFSGTILSTSLTDAHQARVFIRDFAGDFSSSVDVFADVDAAGNFSISLDTIDDASRVVQWGIQLEGVNVWITDVDPFGNIVFQTIPAPGAMALMGMGGLVAARRRR
jgi:hypothetical protein